MEMWRKPINIRAVFTDIDNKEVIDLAKRLHDKYPEPKTTSAIDFIERCRELIYDERNGEPVFHAIAWTISAERLDLQLSPLFKILVTGETPAIRSESIRETLAYALIADIPVYPNTDDLTPVLAKHTRDLFVKGFEAPDQHGKRIRLHLVDVPEPNADLLEYFRNRSLTRQLSPGEVHIARQAALQEITKRDEAGRILAKIELAIFELSNALQASRANERAIQSCLEKNPILFGTEYKRIIPKYRLGSEYELDFALERLDGLVDFVEIEASTRSLFTNEGNPTKWLVHAEQQALDYLDWLERNGAYARDKLPGLTTPVAFVIIGRDASLNKDATKKLRRRNLEFGRRIRILTYDELLKVARNLLCVLNGSQGDGD